MKGHKAINYASFFHEGILIFANKLGSNRLNSQIQGFSD
jgi:hypothetical protein